MARSTDGKSRRVWPNLLGAFTFAGLFGLNAARMYVEGPTATSAVAGLAFAGLAAATAAAANRAYLARRHTRNARANYPDSPMKCPSPTDGAEFLTVAQDEAVTEVQLVSFPDGFLQLLVDLQCEAYDACYNTRPNASWLTVGDALERVLDAAEVPARMMRRPRGQFIPFRK